MADLSLLALVYVVLLGIGGMAKCSFGRNILQVFFWRKRDLCLCPACVCDLSESESDDDGSSDDGGE